MRFPSIESDFWQLESAEDRHQASPEESQIPPRATRASLRRGQAAELLFRILGEEEDGSLAVLTERMWVIITSRTDEYYLGCLSNQPPCLDVDGGHYLRKGVEVPFLPKHVIDWDEPPLGVVRSFPGARASATMATRPTAA